jgi:hypothetical protein
MVVGDNTSCAAKALFSAHEHKFFARLIMQFVVEHGCNV